MRSATWRRMFARSVGEVGELLLWAHGRDAVHVTVDGDLAAVKRARL